MAKYYSLKVYQEQNNNFVIYDAYFDSSWVCPNYKSDKKKELNKGDCFKGTNVLKEVKNEDPFFYADNEVKVKSDNNYGL